MLTPAPVQTTYTQYQGPGQNGMLADSVNFTADTRTVETAAGIGFGLAVSQGTNDRGCIIGGAAFVGITRADHTLPQAAGLTTVDTYQQYDSAGILVMGDIWVIVSAAVTAGAAVSYSATTGQFGSGTVVTQARYMTSAPINGLAVVRVGNIGAPH